MWFPGVLIMAQGTRGKAAVEAERVIEDLKTSLSTDVHAKLDAIKALIVDAPKGIEPRLAYVEKLVESNPDSLVSQVTGIRALVGPDATTPSQANLQDQINELRAEVNDLKSSELATDKLLTGEMGVQLDNVIDAIGVLEDKVSSHESRINSNTAKIHYNNLKISGLGEVVNEDPIHVVSTFFENVLDLPPSFWRHH